ncbi:MAG TPA: TonB-dependent receptor [Vicinamibacteria bacterium]|nr:TonB-dependent receptor [Vicinamibacteria bacterium]
MPEKSPSRGRIRTRALLVLTLVLAAGVARAQGARPPAIAATGTVSGRVLASSGEPARDAHVEIVELGRRVEVDESGRFHFEGVPPGAYIIQAESARAGLSVARVEVAAAQDLTLEVTLDHALHQEVVVVTATPGAATLSEIAQPVSVLSGRELSLRMQPTLGETLAQEPGVSSTYFGPGASRPVIRGLGGDRIRIMQNGLGTADASSTSPDHAVSFDPLSAQQLEVVRGPATLLYGSNAVGGVVNVIDDRVPDTVPDRPLHGKLDLSGASAAEERSGAFSLSGGKEPFAWHADFLRRKTSDVGIPGFAESAALRAEEGEEGEEHEQIEGTLGNSALDNTSGSVGASLVGNRGFLGLAVSGLDSLYGVPGHAHHEEEEHEGEEEEHAEDEDEEAAVRIDLRQRRGDLRGEWRDPFAGFQAVRLRFGVADYEHEELEGEETGTVFSNESWEGRLELRHRAAGPFAGSFGLQGSRRDFSAVGEEAFVPPNLTRTWALFLFEEAARGPWRFQLGGRVERQDIEAGGGVSADRRFTGYSGSAGVAWHGAQGWGGALTVARSTKLPNAEELFSNGPHLATRAFEVGDPGLGKEKSLGVDLSLRKRTGRVAGQVNVFLNRFDDYIYEETTGEEEDGLQVFRFVQRDADFRGAEAQAHVELFHSEPHHVDLDLMADYVRAELRATGEPLPRIPPFRYGVGLHYEGGSWHGRVELRGTGEQDRVASFERATEGYTLLNASLGWRVFLRRSVVEVLLRGTNLTDQEARNHVSFLKDLAPLPGRDVRLSVRLSF